MAAPAGTNGGPGGAPRENGTYTATTWLGPARRPSRHGRRRARRRVRADALRPAELEGRAVVGSSLGGWLGAEIGAAPRRHRRRVAGLVIINGVGVEVPVNPITNISTFTAAEIAKVAYHDIQVRRRRAADDAERLAMMRANAATLPSRKSLPAVIDAAGRFEGIPHPDARALGRVGPGRHRRLRPGWPPRIPTPNSSCQRGRTHAVVEQPTETFRPSIAFVADL